MFDIQPLQPGAVDMCEMIARANWPGDKRVAENIHEETHKSRAYITASRWLVAALLVSLAGLNLTSIMIWPNLSGVMSSRIFAGAVLAGCLLIFVLPIFVRPDSRP